MADYTGKKITYNGSLPKSQFQYPLVPLDDSDNGDPLVADEWVNRRPICPYGCGQEGQLKEIIMLDGKATGVYRDSEGLVFVAPMKMRPNPAQKKLVIGPDGEVKMVEST